VCLKAAFPFVPTSVAEVTVYCCASPPSSPGLALCNEVKDILSGAELPDLKANLLLPEDVALRNLPPLKNAHKRFNFEQDRPVFSAAEEVSRGKS